MSETQKSLRLLARSLAADDDGGAAGAGALAGLLSPRGWRGEAGEGTSLRQSALMG